MWNKYYARLGIFMHTAWEKMFMLLNPYLSFTYGTSGSQNHRNAEVEKDLQDHQPSPALFTTKPCPQVPLPHVLLQF